MRYESLEADIEIVNKIDGRPYRVKNVGKEESKIVEILPEDSTDEPRELTLTPANADFFRFVKNPNPPKVPEDVRIEYGKLVINGKSVSTGTFITPIEVVAVLPGEILFTSDVNDDNFVSLVSYNIRHDKFSVLETVSKNVRVEFPEDGYVIIIDNAITERNRTDDEGNVIVEETGEIKTVKISESTIYDYNNGRLMSIGSDLPPIDEVFITVGKSMTSDGPIIKKSLIATSTANTRWTEDIDADYDGEYLEVIDGSSENTTVYIAAITETEEGTHSIYGMESRGIPGHAVTVYPSIDVSGRISFTIKTEKSLIYTNSGHRAIQIDSPEIVEALTDYNIFLGIRFAKGGAFKTLTYGNENYEKKNVSIETLPDRGDVYTIEIPREYR